MCWQPLTWHRRVSSPDQCRIQGRSTRSNKSPAIHFPGETEAENQPNPVAAEGVTFGEKSGTRYRMRNPSDHPAKKISPRSAATIAFHGDKPMPMGVERIQMRRRHSGPEAGYPKGLRPRTRFAGGPTQGLYISRSRHLRKISADFGDARPAHLACPRPG